MIWYLDNNVGKVGELVVDQGIQSGTEQESVLTVSASQMEKIKAQGMIHTVTCKIKVGTVQAWSVTTQRLSIYTPGRTKIFYPSFFKSLFK